MADPRRVSHKTAVTVTEVAMWNTASCTCCDRRNYLSTIKPSDPADDSHQLYSVEFDAGNMRPTVTLCADHLAELHRVTKR